MKNTTWPGVWPGQARTSKLKSADRHLITMFEKAGRTAVAHALHSIAAAHLGQAVEQKFVFLARTDDRNPQPLGQFVRSSRMIDMPVSEQDLPRRDAGRFDRCEDAVDVTARIDDRRLAVCAVP